MSKVVKKSSPTIWSRAVRAMAVASGEALSGIMPAGTVHGGSTSCVAAVTGCNRNSSARSVACASPVTLSSFSSTTSGAAATPSAVRSSRWFCE